MRKMLKNSQIIRAFAKAAEGLKRAARKSLLFGRRSLPKEQQSALALALDRLQWTEHFLGAMRKSAVARWLYQYKDAGLFPHLIWFSAALLLGLLMGFLKGASFGVGAGVLLAALPLLVSLPPIGVLSALLLLLPVGNTTLCAAFSLLLLICYLNARAFGGLEAKKWDRSDLLLLIFPILCCFSAALSADVGDSFKVVGMWSSLFLAAPLVRRTVRSKRALITALAALVIGGVLSGAVGLYQYFSGMVETLWTDTELFEELELRVYSTFANPNVYGEFLLLLIPLTTALAMYVRRAAWRTLLIGADVLLFVNLVLTYSRGCYTGIAVAAVVFLWHFNKKWMVAILAAAVPVALLAMPDTVMDRILSIGNMADGSTAYRMYIYLGTLAMLGTYWFCGIGIGEGAYRAVYPAYSYSGIEEAPHAHSLFLQGAVSFGIMGVAYLLLCFHYYHRTLSMACAPLKGRSRLLMLGFRSVMWGFITQSIFDYTWYNYRIFQLFWILLLLGVTAAGVMKEDADD